VRRAGGRPPQLTLTRKDKLDATGSFDPRLRSRFRGLSVTDAR